MQEKEEYAFELGQCVNHINGGMIAVVRARTKTAMGRELYEIVEFPTGRIRHILGWALVRLMPGPQCAICPLVACLA